MEQFTSHRQETSYELVTPELAAKWLAHHTYKYQRTLSEPKVEDYAEAMKRNLFITTSAILFLHVGPDIALGDGQHRLNAIIRSGRSYYLPITRFHCESEEERMRVYANTDIGKPRSHNDAMRVHADEFIALGLGMEAASRTAQAIPILASGFTSAGMNTFTAKSRDARLAGMRQWVSEASRYFAVTESGQKRKDPHSNGLRRSATIAVALATFRYESDKAEKFWNAVGENDRLERDSPEWVLVNRILIPPLKSTYYKGTFGNTSVYCRRIAACWNAWYQSRPLTMAKVFDISVPIRIFGTPYNGRKVIAYDPLTEQPPTLDGKADKA